MASASIKANLTVVLDSSDAAFNVTALGLTATRPLTVIDAYAIGRANDGGGTAQLRNGTTAIIPALACAADGTFARPTIDYSSTAASIAVNDSLNILANQAGTRGVVYVTVIPGAIPAV
jgi:hypothetical protein